MGRGVGRSRGDGGLAARGATNVRGGRLPFVAPIPARFLWFAVVALGAGCPNGCSNASLHPAHELCDNGLDDDGDGQMDCADTDCFEQCTRPCTDACAQGDRLCTPSGEVASCALSDAGCWAPTAIESCPPGLVCSAGVCQYPCVDRCELGTKLCASASTALSCATLATGCRDFQVDVTCSAAQDCSGGACVPHGACADQCVLGDSRCVGGAMQGCVRLSTGCTEWTVPLGCPAGQVCGPSGGCEVADAGTTTMDAGPPPDAGPVDAGPTCGQDNDSCLYGSECCSGYCTQAGKCISQCRADGDFCGGLPSNPPCCHGLDCWFGHCKCAGTGQSCGNVSGSNLGCCAGAGSCTPMATGSVCCVGAGGSCGGGAGCCYGTGGCMNGTCINSVCTTNGNCQSNQECCSGKCNFSSGICLPS